MSIGSILLGFSLLILVGLFLSRPFVVAPGRERRRRRGRHAMLQEKNVLLEQIRLLDFEYETGKLPTEIYEAQRESLVKETAVLLQKLDTAPVGSGNAANLDTKIEAAIAQIRGQEPVAAAQAAPVKTAVKSSPGGFCPQCGNPADAGDKFCSTCGHKLV
jgi:hypothetical protein